MGYTKAEADFELRYGYEEYEVLLGFRPTANESANAPFHVACHGGLFSNPGYLSMSQMGANIADTLRAAGFYVFVIDHTPAGFNADWHLTPFSARLWPGPLLSVMRALTFIASNSSYDSEFGPTIFADATHSIDPNRGSGLGSSSGADLMMLASLMPAGRYPVSGVMGLDLEQYSGAIPRLRVVSNLIGQLDWTQYAFPQDGGLGPVYDNDLHQAISYPTGVGPWLTWTNTPMRIKKQLSPVWWLRSGYPGHKNIHFYHSYPTAQNGYGNNLDAADWEPGVVKDDFAGLKAFSEPHDPYQAYGAAIEWGKAKVPALVYRGQRKITYNPETGLTTNGPIESGHSDNVTCPAYIRSVLGA